MFNSIKKSDLVRNVMILMTGTVFAQALSYAVSPILSRLYDEHDMADLGLYMRIVGLLSAVATARFEMTLPIVKSDYHSFLLFRVSLKITKFILFGFLIIGLCYLIIAPFDGSTLWLFLFSIASAYFVVFINLGTNWSIRHQLFRKISQQRFANSLVSNSFKLLFGFLAFGAIGLILATFIGYVSSSLGFIRDFLKNKGLKKNEYSKAKINLLVKEYREFPLVNLPHVFLDFSRDLLVAFLIVYHFGKNDFGSYVYSTMMLGIPAAIMGQSISQVFFNRCSQLVNDNRPILKLIFRSYISLFLLSLVPFGLLFFYGEEIFVFVFGSNWANAGRFSEIMSIWMMGNFVVSSTLTLPIILNRQKENFIFGLIGSCLQIFSFGVLPTYFGKTMDSFIQIIWILSVSQLILLLLVSTFLISFAKKGRKIM
jgi:O-antigen/teichoic acid export membrane protein